MARTKQTARRSTGGRAPRMQLSTRAARRSPNWNLERELERANDQMHRQMDMCIKGNGVGQRTITVEGQAELLEPPDLVHLSFKMTAKGDTLQGAIRNCMAKIGKIRSLVVGCGVPRANVTSDSIGTEVKKFEYGKYLENNKRRNKEDKDDEEDNEALVWKANRSKFVYHAQAVVRVTLEVDTGEDEEGQKISELFSRVYYAIMVNDDNILMHDAPRYELSDITDLRNTARKEACQNAKQKATYIIEALENEAVTLGKPICFTDVHCDIQDDAEDSFCGNFANTASCDVTRIVEGEEEEAEGADGDYDMMDDASIRSSKRPKLSETIQELAADEISRIFTVPPIKVIACIKAVFEIDAA